MACRHQGSISRFCSSSRDIQRLWRTPLDFPGCGGGGQFSATTQAQRAGRGGARAQPVRNPLAERAANGNGTEANLGSGLGQGRGSDAGPDADAYKLRDIIMLHSASSAEAVPVL